MAAVTNPIKISPANFKGEQIVQEQNEIYHKYYSCSFDNLTKAYEERKRSITKFPRAFVDAFNGDQPILVGDSKMKVQYSK